MIKTKKIIEQEHPESITTEALGYLKVVVTSELFNDAVRFTMKICPDMGITYDDLLYAMKVKENPHGQYWANEAELWENSSEEQKKIKLELDPDFDVNKVETVVKDITDRRLKLANLPVNMAMALHVKGYENKEQIGWQVTDFREIVRHALWGHKEFDLSRGKYEEHMELIRNTPYQILTELFFKIFIQPADAYQNCFFFNLFISLLKASVPLLNIMMPENPNLQTENLPNE